MLRWLFNSSWALPVLFTVGACSSGEMIGVYKNPQACPLITEKKYMWVALPTAWSICQIKRVIK